MANVKRVVAHKKLYLAVKGKLELIPEGSEIVISQEQYEELSQKLVTPKESKKVIDEKPEKVAKSK